MQSSLFPAHLVERGRPSSDLAARLDTFARIVLYCERWLEKKESLATNGLLAVRLPMYLRGREAAVCSISAAQLVNDILDHAANEQITINIAEIERGLIQVAEYSKFI